MNPNIPSQTQGAALAWQTIGEMMLPVRPEDGASILSLLEEKLAPLQLPVELIDRIVKSIQVVSVRAERGGIRMEHIHLFLFVPANYRIMRGTWGFFRIERINDGEGNTSPSHAVDLYLYPEAG
jgi:hypothetical protein